VSTFVIFEILVKPLLYALMGLDWVPFTVTARLTEDIRRRDAERVEYRPVVLESEEIRLIPYHGSSHLNALSQTNALIRIDRGVGMIEKGAMLRVRPL
jgi:molybdopterin molybdotransferase